MPTVRAFHMMRVLARVQMPETVLVEAATEEEVEMVVTPCVEADMAQSINLLLLAAAGAAQPPELVAERLSSMYLSRAGQLQ
jgi:hypothetical protein